VSLRRRVASALLATLATAAPALEPVQCPNRRIMVAAADVADFDAGCSAAVSAIAFLESQGVPARKPIEISFVEALPPIVSERPSVGCYVHSEDRIYVLSFERCCSLRLGHDVPVDRSVHRGLVAHEVAHSIVAAHVAPGRLGTLAHEYIAYVVMYASLPAAERERLLAYTPGRGFQAEVEINLTIYLLDPVRFGAQSYRHSFPLADGPGFLSRVLAGQVLGDE
jgi:hypothetical protein